MVLLGQKRTLKLLIPRLPSNRNLCEKSSGSAVLWRSFFHCAIFFLVGKKSESNSKFLYFLCPQTISYIWVKIWLSTLQMPKNWAHFYGEDFPLPFRGFFGRWIGPVRFTDRIRSFRLLIFFWIMSIYHRPPKLRVYSVYTHRCETNVSIVYVITSITSIHPNIWQYVVPVIPAAISRLEAQ